VATVPGLLRVPAARLSGPSTSSLDVAYLKRQILLPTSLIGGLYLGDSLVSRNRNDR
jgi:hypothetical protein